jgi:hypothetical protein
MKVMLLLDTELLNEFQISDKTSSDKREILKKQYHITSAE